MSQRNGNENDPGHSPHSFHLTLDGENRIIPITGNETLLEAALAAGIDAPFSCTEGHCGTCMSWLRKGDVSITDTRGLSKRNIERGYILACQALFLSIENAPSRA